MSGFIRMDDLNITGRNQVETSSEVEQRQDKHPVRHMPACKEVLIAQRTETSGGWGTPTKYVRICQCGGKSEPFAL